jgi:hypothetical protein
MHTFVDDMILRAGHRKSERHKAMQTICTLLVPILKRECEDVAVNGGTFMRYQLPTTHPGYRLILAALRDKYPQTNGHTQMVRDLSRCVEETLTGMDFVSVRCRRSRGAWKITMSCMWKGEPTPRVPSHLVVTCPVCIEQKACDVLVPCGHCVCDSCMPHLDACPLCRSSVRMTQHVFVQ